MSPNARSLHVLREDGYIADVVERFCGRIRRDWCGLADVIGLRSDGAVLVQATTASNAASRRRKILEHPQFDAISRVARIELFAWRKVKGRWQCRRELVEKSARGEGVA